MAFLVVGHILLSTSNEVFKVLPYSRICALTTKNAIQKHKSGFSDWSGDENINNWDVLIENFVTVYEARLEGMNTLITSGNFIK